MLGEKKFYLSLIIVILLAILLRFFIMPFSFHGHDIFWINCFPHKFIEGEIKDPYLYIKENSSKMEGASFAHGVGAYYPPGTFWIFVVFGYLFKPFLPKSNEICSVFTTFSSSSWSFPYPYTGNTIHFADALINYQLYRTLFLFKVPYLICDIVIGFALYQLLKEDKKKAFIGLVIWAFNPFVLHSIYALGQLDIIVAMFIVLSLLAIKFKRPYLAVVSMSLGAGVKIIPFLLIPPIIIILGKTIRKQIKLLLTSLAVFLAPFIPFFLNSKSAVFHIFYKASDFEISPLRGVIFISAYLLFLTILYFFKVKRDSDDLKILTFSFISVLLLFYLYDVTLRFFVLVTPLLIMLAVRDKIFWIYNVIFFITLFELRACANTQQWGLFAALHPEFFSSLPIADSFLNLLVNVKYIHQYMYRLFVLSCAIMVAHIFMLNRNLFRFHLPIRAKDEKR